MSAAVMFLTETDLSIAHIAEELGYASAPYFSSAFRSYFKICPNSLGSSKSGLDISVKKSRYPLLLRKSV